TARATAGITEAVAGSGVYHFAHPDPGTLLLFVFDIGDGEVGASVWDDGVSPQAAAQAAIVAEPATLTAAYDHAKDDVLTPLAAVDGKVDAILAEDVGADLGTDVCTITLRDEGGNAVADARVYVSSDAAGLVRSDIRVTNALGQVAFDLTAGNTYYLWAFSTLVDFTAANPMSFVAAAD
ncbi:MAG: hypothetical protein WDA37_10150, partial [Dysgonamonadaceae bacterium]